MAAARDLVVLGTTDFAVEVADVAEQSGWRVVAFVENLDIGRCRDALEGLPIVWVDELTGMSRTHVAVCGLGTTHRQRFTDQAEELGMSFATVVHPTAVVSRRSSIGPGSVIGVRTVVGAVSRLGRHVLMNRGAMVGHHTEVGDFASLQPGSNVAGSCMIGEGTYVGMGAAVIDHRKVGSHSVVGAGAVVTHDLPDHVLAVGMPARVIREAIDGT